MKTEVRHHESWHVTVSREFGDAWPDIATRPGSWPEQYMRPESAAFRVVAGHDEPADIQVYGTKAGGDGPAVSRYHARRLPAWLAAVIEDARQDLGLTPADIAV